MELLFWGIAALLVLGAGFARRGRTAAILVIAAIYFGAVAAGQACDSAALGVEVCRG